MPTLIGSTTAIFVISLSQALTDQVDVAWSTRDGLAKAGAHYVAANGVVTFLPGETDKQIQVTVYGQDVVTADNMNFFIDLAPPTNAVLGTQLVECVIRVEDQDGVTITNVVVAQGQRGVKGDPGLSAYELAVLMGYTGTIEQWVAEKSNAVATKSNVRPVTGLYVGRMHMDTVINPNGRPIWWNGAAWVDAGGAVV